jgi:hypothetical protein
MTDKNGFDALMDDVCVRWGFCGSMKHREHLHVTLIIPPDGPVTADQFVEWVFLAENMNPNNDLERWQKHKDNIRAAFVRHMGAEMVDARRLRYSSVVASEGPDTD